MRRQVPSGLSKTASNQSVTSSKAPCICSFSKKTHRLYDKVEGCLDVSCLKADGHRHMACMLQARAPANVGAAGCPRVLPWSLPAWTRSAAGRPCSMTACRKCFTVTACDCQCQCPNKLGAAALCSPDARRCEAACFRCSGDALTAKEGQPMQPPS